MTRRARDRKKGAKSPTSATFLSQPLTQHTRRIFYQAQEHSTKRCQMVRQNCSSPAKCLTTPATCCQVQKRCKKKTAEMGGVVFVRLEFRSSSEPNDCCADEQWDCSKNPPSPASAHCSGALPTESQLEGYWKMGKQEGKTKVLHLSSQLVRDTQMLQLLWTPSLANTCLMVLILLVSTTMVLEQSLDHKYYLFPWSFQP